MASAERDAVYSRWKPADRSAAFTFGSSIGGGSWWRSLAYAGLFATLVLALLEFREQRPDLVRAWSTKGAPLDLVGPTLLLIGSLAALRLAKRWRVFQLRRYGLWLGYAGLLWFLAMEEIGWGHDALRFPRPEIDGIAVDSFHDLLRLLKKMHTSEVALLFKASGGLALAGLLAVLLTRAGRTVLGAANVSIALLVLLGFGSIFAATILDVKVTDVFWFLRHRPPYELEETLELVGELMLSLVVVEGWLCRRAATKRSSASQFWPAPLAARSVPAVE